MRKSRYYFHRRMKGWNVKERLRLLFQLFVSFAKVGTLTFGGGYAMLPILEAEVVGRRKWISDEELLDFYAVAQTTPGVIVVNTATFIGFTESRYLGAIVATIGVVTPSVIIITILATLSTAVEGSYYFEKALTGINIAVAGLLISSVVRLGKKSVKSWGGGAIALLSFLLVQFLGVSALVVIPLAAMPGIFAMRIKR